MNRTDEQQLRLDFEQWFDDAAAKNIEAVMTRIAEDVVSYEHVAQLQHVGSNAVREVCQAGFDAATGDFRWDIPELNVITSGDIAVAWGMNRMRFQEPGHEPVETWSRGTRIFRNTDGKWELIHQHLSFPLDPATGLAATDLQP